MGTPVSKVYPDMKHLCRSLVLFIFLGACIQVMDAQCPDNVTVTSNDHCLWVYWEGTPPSPLPEPLLEAGEVHTLRGGIGTAQDPAFYQSSGGNGACNAGRGPFTGTISAEGETCDFVDGMLDVSLPIELSHFSVELDLKVAVLHWTTSSEINNAGFEVQRSVNGIDWDVLSWIEGQGNSSELRSYTYQDFFPIVGNNYYRLKQMDVDGAFTYSSVVSINIDRVVDGLKVFPNPVADVLNIYDGGRDADWDHMAIYDAFGRKINPTIISNTQILVTDLPSGIYFLQQLDSDRQQMHRFVVRR